MKNKIPTAEEFYLSSIFTDNIIKNTQHPFWALNNELTIKTVELMKEFAIFHVKAALEAAAENAQLITKYIDDVYDSNFEDTALPGEEIFLRTDGDGQPYAASKVTVNKDSILDAYPKENIK